MTRTCLILLLILSPLAAGAQEPVDDSATAAAAAGTPGNAPAHMTPGSTGASPVYWGGGVTLGFGDVTRIGVYPLVGYRVAPKLSLGAKIAYEYIKDTRYNVDHEYSNYGGGLFGRYFVVPQIYAHAEYQYNNYEIWYTDGSTNREWVPFLLLGGGFRTMISARTSAYVEVLFDVLQDDLSPYESGEPRFSAGVAVGF